MGRELRRVPLDFDWPMKKVWEGYINPNRRPCPERHKTCFNGQTGGSQWLHAILRVLALAASESVGVRDVQTFEAKKRECDSQQRIFLHPYLRDLLTAPAYLKNEEIVKPGEPYPDLSALDYRQTPPTDDLVLLIEKLSGYKMSWLGDSTVVFGLKRAMLKAAGLDEEMWGVCRVCKGDNIDPAVRAAYDAWKPSDPPTGDGFQLWETTSEGSPASPVFKTLDELCAWCETGATTFANHTTTKERWKEMLERDFVHHREGNMTFI